MASKRTNATAVGKLMVGDGWRHINHPDATEGTRMGQIYTSTAAAINGEHSLHPSQNDGESDCDQNVKHAGRRLILQVSRPRRIKDFTKAEKPTRR